MRRNKIRILSTKLLSPSIKEQAKGCHIVIEEKEFISITPIHSKEICKEIAAVMKNKNLSNVVFTSSSAVEIVENYLHKEGIKQETNWDIFCLSGKTRRALNLLNEKRIVATAENASVLAQKIIDKGIKKVIFFCGNKRRNDLPGILKEGGVLVKEIVVYETIETPKISNKSFEGILFFSPSAVSSFFSVNHLNKETICFAIGKTTAAAIARYAVNKIITSESPTQEMMLAAINFYFENINCY